jgi:hypothetical protein
VPPTWPSGGARRQRAAACPEHPGQLPTPPRGTNRRNCASGRHAQGLCCVDGSHVGQGGLMRRRRVPPSRPRSGFAGFRFPPRGDHGRGALVPALRAVLPRRGGAPRRAWRPGHGSPDRDSAVADRVRHTGPRRESDLRADSLFYRAPAPGRDHPGILGGSPTPLGTATAKDSISGRDAEGCRAAITRSHRGAEN